MKFRRGGMNIDGKYNWEKYCFLDFGDEQPNRSFKQELFKQIEVLLAVGEK